VRVSVDRQLTGLLTQSPKLVVVGNSDAAHVGAHLYNAAAALGYSATRAESEAAFSANRLTRMINWHFRGRRPTRLREFSRNLVDVCRTERARWVLTTGLAPVDDAALQQIGALGITRLNYLTDDPWNPTHAAPWFMKALRQYDWIFSTRTSNLDDLQKHGCPRVCYLPFAYDPGIHRAEQPLRGDEALRFDADVAFAGGADPDRVPLVAALIRAGFRVALYGGYWHRYRETKAAARGLADPHTVRKAIAGARVALCLVRRANRDGSSMRSFEVAAMGACMLAEYTEEHRSILGDDGQAVVYFRSPHQMIERVRWLLAHADERRRLGAAVQARITNGQNTYRDRLRTMLAATGEASVARD
jgi:spore maturation protein CgeB